MGLLEPLILFAAIIAEIVPFMQSSFLLQVLVPSDS